MKMQAHDGAATPSDLTHGQRLVVGKFLLATQNPRERFESITVDGNRIDLDRERLRDAYIAHQGQASRLRRSSGRSASAASDGSKEGSFRRKNWFRGESRKRAVRARAPPQLRPGEVRYVRRLGEDEGRQTNDREAAVQR